MVDGTLRGRAADTGPRDLHIDGIPKLAWGASGDCTFAGALSAAASVTAHPCDYQALLGATGLAFRVRWFQGPPPTRWCPSSPVGEFPDEMRAAGRATGWELRTECWLDRPDVRAETYAPQIVASLDSGLPVLAYDRSLNLAVLTGYEDGGAAFLMNGYLEEEPAVRVPAAEIGPMVVFLGRHTDPLLPHDAAVAGLRMAVRNWRRRHDPDDDEARGYWMGAQALERWRDDIGRVDTLTDEERAALFFVSWWNMDGMADARMNAGPYLRNSAGTFGYAAREAILRAADIYDEDAALLSRTFVQKDVFLGGWTGKTIADWSPEVRASEREILARAASLEEKAIAHLERALDE